MEVGIQTDPEFYPEAPRLVVPGEYENGTIPVFPNYDATPDGQRFLVNSAGDVGEPRVALITNWLAELNR